MEEMDLSPAYLVRINYYYAFYKCGLNTLKSIINSIFTPRNIIQLKMVLANKFGPCGLLCEKCFAFENGPIQHHAEQLSSHFGEFDIYAKRFETLLNEPKFSSYPEFKEFLQLLSSKKCKGCRQQQCHLFTNCKVRDCYKSQNVDYCYQCKSFPCNNTGFDENLQNRWLAINRKIQEIGLANYYDEIKDKPRY